jgi:hypothetical protein
VLSSKLLASGTHVAIWDRAMYQRHRAVRCDADARDANSARMQINQSERSARLPPRDTSG